MHMHMHMQVCVFSYAGCFPGDKYAGVRLDECTVYSMQVVEVCMHM